MTLGSAVGAARLGDLVFVVRKDQVEAAAVYLEDSPRSAALIAEHSMCQPGRPMPHGLSQPGSLARGQFHSTKSAGLCLCASTAMRAPAWWSSSVRFDIAP